jgi:hypothetical protein
MLATYEEALREQFLARMRSDVKVLPTGTDESGLTWTLRFTESSTLETAWGELNRLGLAGDAEVSAARRAVIVPRRSPRGTRSLDVLDQLGLSAPK